MDETKVSIITPIYNASKHLRQCLDSILAQTLQEFELICVDDGSTDDSPAILKEYAQKDPRVRVITQKNQYAGAARNAGKKTARGKYLVFWDSDDFFRPNALAVLYAQSEKDDADICICGASQYFDDVGKLYPSNEYIRKSYIPDQLPFNRHTHPDYVLNVTTAHPWNKMFRRSFIESISLDFQVTCNGDDIFFVISALALAQRITLVNKSLVCYRINQPDSLASQIGKAPLVPIENWILTRESLLEKDALPKRSFDNKVIGSLIYFLHSQNSLESFQESLRFLRETGLARLGLSDVPEGYFYNPAYEECLHHMLTDSTEDFLFYFLTRAYHAKSLLSGQVRASRKKNRRLSKQIAALESEAAQSADELTALLQEQKDLQKKLKTARRANRRNKRRLRALENSWSYRIGRAVTYLPRKVKQLFRRSN